MILVILLAAFVSRKSTTQYISVHRRGNFIITPSGESVPVEIKDGGYYVDGRYIGKQVREFKE